MSERERELTLALRGLLRVVETFPHESSDVRPLIEDASKTAREALRPIGRESRQPELVA